MSQQIAQLDNRTSVAPSASARQRSASRRITRRVVLAFGAVLVALASVFGLAVPADATTWGGGQITSSSTWCWPTTHSMEVSASASQFTNSAAYTNGQWIRYRIQTRDVTYSSSSSWVNSTGWSAWVWINGITTASTLWGPYTITSPMTLGTTRLYGTARHQYQTRVQYDWWTGASNVGTDPEMSYSQYQSVYVTNPSKCWL